MTSNPSLHKAIPDLFDGRLLRRRLPRLSFADLPFCADLNAEIALRLAPVKRDFADALILYPPCPLDTALQGKAEHVAVRPLADLVPQPDDLQIAPHSADLIITCLGLHYANDLPGALIQLRRGLKPGGLLLGCLVGGQSLHELREAFAAAEITMTGGVTPRVHPGIDIKQVGALLQRTKFLEPIVDIEKYDFAYASVFDLLYDLRKWGGNLLTERQKHFTQGSLMKAMAAAYDTQFGKDNKIPATFELIWFSAWA